MIEFLISGTLLGLSAGLAPGPLLILLVSETLTKGFKAGAKVSFSPLLTDAPIVAGSFLLFTQLSNITWFLGVVSMLGACFILYIAIKNIKVNAVDTTGSSKPQNTSIFNLAMVNALSPHPYMFWLTIGAPMMISAIKESFMASALFVTSFYVMMIGSKLFVTLLISKYKNLLNSATYYWILKLLGLLLALMAMYLFYEGLIILKLIG